MKRKKFRPLKCINGAKGVIALFLAILMTPFLTVATVLVETGRYNSAVSILDEAMGTSAISTLANYDPYLRERWGLLALSQDTDIDALFNEYFNINKGVLGNSLKLNSPISAKGMYPLSDGDFLNAQILEFAKYNAPVRLGTEGVVLAIDELINFLDLDIIKEVINSLIPAFNAFAGYASSMKTLVTSTQKLAENIKTLEQYKTFYDEAYSEFERTANELISALESEEGASQNLTDNFQTAKEDYATIIQDLISALSACATELVNCTSATVKLSQYATNMAKPNFGSMSSNGNIAEKIYDASVDGANAAAASWGDAVKESEADVFEHITIQLQELIDKVNSLDITASTKQITKEEYYFSITDHLTSEELLKFMAQQAAELSNAKLLQYLQQLNNVLNSLFKTSLFFDPSLSSIIDMNFYYNEIGGLPSSLRDSEISELVNNITTFLSELLSCIQAISAGEYLSALDEAEAVAKSAVNTFKSLIKYIESIITRLATVMRDQLWYSTYSAYNLTCRTDNTPNGIYYNKPMTNYIVGSSATTIMPYPSLPTSAIMSSNISPIDDFAAIIDNITALASGAGADITFSGAEIEYIIGGTTSEVANQLLTFIGIYIIRLIADLVPVLTDADLQGVAALTTIGYPAVLAIAAFVEPLLDTIFLVNGQTVPMIKLSGIYLSPTGIPSIVKQLTDLDLDPTQSATVTNSVTSSLTSIGTSSNSSHSPVIVNSTRGIARMSDRLLKEAEADFNEEKPTNFTGTLSKENPIDEEKPTSTPKSNINLQKENPADDEEKPSKNKEKIPKDKKPKEDADGEESGTLLKNLIHLDYREHCFIYLFLALTSDIQLMRLSNLIQMESTYYYQQKNGADFVFDLNKAYTYIESEADVSIKQMLPSLADSSLFTIKRKNYRGY